MDRTVGRNVKPSVATIEIVIVKNTKWTTGGSENSSLF